MEAVAMEAGMVAKGVMEVEMAVIGVERSNGARSRWF